MKGLLLKDFLSIKKTLKMLSGVLLLFSVVFIAQGNEMIYGIISLLCAMMVITTISYDDLAKWDTYALTMPISRKEIVQSKYLGLGLLTVFGSLLSLFIGVAGSFIMRTEFLKENFLILPIVALVALVFGSLIIALIYKFGTEKARLLIVLCACFPAVLTFLFSEISKQNAFIMNEDHVMILEIALVILSIVIIITSYFFSLKIYNKKEF